MQRNRKKLTDLLIKNMVVWIDILESRNKEKDLTNDLPSHSREVMESSKHGHRIRKFGSVLVHDRFFFHDASDAVFTSERDQEVMNDV